MSWLRRALQRRVSYDWASDPDLLPALRKSLRASRVDGKDLLTWTCPRCAHPNGQEVDREGTFVGLDAGRVSTHPRQGLYTVRCNCQKTHRGRPAGATWKGCGHHADVTLMEHLP